MIQRKQTIYLGLAFISMLLTLFFPLFTIESTVCATGAPEVVTYGAYGMSNGDMNADMPLYIIFIFLAVLTAVGIAFFKNRKRQLLVTRINLILTILLAISLAIFYYVFSGVVAKEVGMKGYCEATVNVGVGFFMVVAAIPFLILAIRGIRADEALLKSIDRIR